ncbi:MAG: diaminopimelate decarboxylase [Candidatus Limnocylindrales bacterium]
MTTVGPAPETGTGAGPRSVSTRPASSPDWWIRPGLGIRAGRLIVAGQDAEALARERGTPLFVYDLERVAENARAIVGALGRSGVHHRVRFALKANHEPEVLAVLRGLGAPGSPRAVGIDACSPGEVEHALASGWRRDEISFTGTNLSERDLDVLLPTGVHLNVDAISQIERVGRRAPGRRIGLRVNPGAGAGYHEGLAYSGERPTKFGIYDERLTEAVEAARRYDLTVDTVHFHAGSGWLADGLPAFETALASAARMVDRLVELGCPIDEVNVGGGLGAPARQDERPIDLDAYAAVLARHLGPRGVAVAVEPGDYLVKDAAILLGEIVTIEDRRETRFVGLDLGWNIDCSYFIYRFAQEAVLCRAADAARTQRVTLAGHINEAGDVFAEDYPLPEVVEGDIVALLNAGGYKQAMSSTHCLRPIAPALYLDRAPE